MVRCSHRLNGWCRLHKGWRDLPEIPCPRPLCNVTHHRALRPGERPEYLLSQPVRPVRRESAVGGSGHGIFIDPGPRGKESGYEVIRGAFVGSGRRDHAEYFDLFQFCKIGSKCPDFRLSWKKPPCGNGRAGNRRPGRGEPAELRRARRDGRQVSEDGMGNRE